MVKRCFLLFIGFFLVSTAWANDWVVIDSILIEGNVRTKEDIILRELDFEPGDSLKFNELHAILDRNRQQLLNTALFTQVDINIKEWKAPENRITLKIKLLETWYIYPVPILELSDRNFNVWWDQFDHQLGRLNYGLRMYHINLTGRWDVLKFIAQFGFTQKYGLEYSMPYINGDKTLGLAVDVSYKRNRSIHYTNVGNKQIFFRNDLDFVLKRFESRIWSTYRPGLYTWHVVEGAFRKNEVDSIVVNDLNHKIFNDNAVKQSYFSLAYRFQFNNTDVHAYPTRGKRIDFSVVKNGLGLYDDLDALILAARYSNYHSFNQKWSIENAFRTQISLVREEQPFYNFRALGFGKNVVRGFELYLMDGFDTFVNSNTLSYRIIDHNWDWKNWMPLKALRQMPITVFLSTHFDWGYANNPYSTIDNELENVMLGGAGVGLSVQVYNNKVFKVEYSLNSLKESGIFLRTDFGF